MIEFARFVSDLNLNDIEVGILCGITFTSINGRIINSTFPHILRLIHANLTKLDISIRNAITSENLSKINTLNMDLMEALQFEIRNRLKSPNSSSMSADDADIQTMFAKINALLGQLAQIGHTHAAQFIQLYKHHKYKMKIPSLLSEIYEIENGPSSTGGGGGYNEPAPAHTLPNIASSTNNGHNNISFIKKESSNFIRFESSAAIINAM
jgi:hypothetical protein